MSISKYLFIFLLFSFSSHAFNNQQDKFEKTPREICQIGQDFMLKWSARDRIDNSNDWTEWRIREIKLAKGDFIYIYKKKNGLYNYVTSDLDKSFPIKNNDGDKIESSFLYEDIKIDDVIVYFKKIK
jgi:hypothetical protein